MKWTKKWPEKEGWYWVYGITYKNEADFELSVMKVMKASNTLMYIRNGNFYYKSEAGDVMFQKITEPNNLNECVRKIKKSPPVPRKIKPKWRNVEKHSATLAEAKRII